MTNIGNVTQKYEQQTLISDTVDRRRVESQELRQPESNSDALKNDKVSLSQTSREMQLTKSAVAETPDVREELVAKIRQAIAENRYEMNAEKTADKVVGLHISEII